MDHGRLRPSAPSRLRVAPYCVMPLPDDLSDAPVAQLVETVHLFTGAIEDGCLRWYPPPQRESYQTWCAL